MNAAGAITAAPEAIVPQRQWRRSPLLAALVALLIAAAGAAWLLSPRSSESTDNAYVKADSSSVAPKVGGLVSAVLVEDNQLVRAGQPVVRLDTRDYDARVVAAEAQLADARAAVADAQASLLALDADERLARAGVRSAQTTIRSADAEYVRAAADRARFETLAAQGFATRRDLERVRATSIGAAAALDRSRADSDVASERASVTSAQRPVLEAKLAGARAMEARASAARDLARLDRTYAVVKAPFDGVVGNRQVQIGDYVQPGTRLLTLVPSAAVYVIANFKETQTRNMVAGQRALVAVDALGGANLHGRVQSIAPASGSEFTLLPFEPGSGNFTKIVQRVAVKIVLDPGQPLLSRLRPGLSVTAKVSLSGA
jgi:membrane fusion protein (multidrug efflux system)